MEEDPKWRVAGTVGDQGRTDGEQHPSKPPQRSSWSSWRNLPGAATCGALCLLCVGVCIVVFVRTSELQSRIVSLEQQQLSAWMLSLEQVEPVVFSRLDQILEEVSPSISMLQPSPTEVVSV